MTGGTGNDTFVLYGGSAIEAVGPFYRFGGDRDYALITDFNPCEDTILLARTEQGLSVPTVEVEYSLGASPEGLPQGTAIYANNLGAQPDVIAILQNVSPECLNLSAPYFQFV